MKFSGHIALTQPRKAKAISVKVRHVSIHASAKPMKMGALKKLSNSAVIRPSQVSNLGGGIGGMQKARRLK